MILKNKKNKNLRLKQFVKLFVPRSTQKGLGRPKQSFGLGSKFSSLLTAYYPLPTSKGFLLVEMIVSVALFSVVMTIGMGSLLSIMSANRKSQSFKVVINNVNLGIESMSRDIRTGYDYNCGSVTGGDCVAGDDIIYFVSSSGEDIIYRFNNVSESIEKSVDGSAFSSIIAQDISITNLKFYVLGATVGDNTQPRVAITVQAHTTGTKVSESVDFGLYTTVSQRKLDS
ncbi:type II secretion system GspH family protein [Patescibacteria group bacterium]|nr:type II secretion system GspH family protein [Patescibacteria group bacterium]MCG2694598.1 type II secretion system GspH family protein [Candidatus Parcubacteria bacterium]